MKVFTTFLIFTFMVCISCSALLGQTQPKTKAQGQIVVDQSLRELFIRTEQISRQQAAHLKSLSDAEKEAADDLSKFTHASQVADLELERAKVNVSMVQPQPHGIYQPQWAVLYGDYESSVRRMNTAKAKASQLEISRSEAEKRLHNIRSSREAAEVQYRLTLSATTEAWKYYLAWSESETDESFKTLTSFLTEMAAKNHETSDVELVTQDSQKKETTGALIFYETELDRKNKVQPVKTSNCATGCVQKDMAKGWYYMWSVRNDRETSNKDRYVHVGGSDKRVEIVEDRR